MVRPLFSKKYCICSTYNELFLIALCDLFECFFTPTFIHSSLHQHTEEESVVKILLLLYSSVEASRGLLPCVYFCKKASVFVFVKAGQHNKYLILMHV